MNNNSEPDLFNSKSPTTATKHAVIAAFITSGLVSWATPDGNLVVTLVPGLGVGLVVFGVSKWLTRRG